MTQVTRPGAPALDGPRIDRWTAASVPWWVPRIVLTLAWAGALAAAFAGDDRPCTPADPTVCGPDVPFAVAIVALFATPILLWWLPLAGCAAGVVFAFFDLVYDEVAAARVGFALHGLLCLAVAAWLVTARRRQAAIIAEVAGTVRVEEKLAQRLRDEIAGWGGRSVLAGLLIVAGVGGIAWYDHRAGQVAAHEAAAVRTDAVVRSFDDAEGVVTVEVPQPVRIWVLDSYEAGQVVPVLVDGEWVKLAGEPEDVTPWLSAGLGALVLAAILLIREQRMRAARRRLLSGPLPAVELTAVPDDEGRAVLQDGMALVPAVVTPLEEQDEDDDEEDEDGDGEWTVEEIEEFGETWRSTTTAEEPRVATVAGDLSYGGWVLLITDDAVLLPEAPVRRPPRRPVRVRVPPGEPLPDIDAGDLPDLPLVLRPGRRTRALGALSVLGFVAGPALVLSGLPEDWWETLILLWLGGFLAYGGWSRLASRVELTRTGFVVHGGLRVHEVPWPLLHGVRCDEKGLWLAWEPDFTVQLHGVPEHQGAVMMRLRELSLAAGDPGGRSGSRLGGGAAVLLAYALIAAAVTWWSLSTPA